MSLDHCDKKPVCINFAKKLANRTHVSVHTYRINSDACLSRQPHFFLPWPCYFSTKIRITLNAEEASISSLPFVSIEAERRAFCAGHTSSRGDFQFAIKRRSICNLMEGSRIWIGALCTIHSPIFLPFVSLAFSLQRSINAVHFEPVFETVSWLKREFKGGDSPPNADSIFR